MIELRNITKYHEDDIVLNDISLRIEEGTQVGLIGPGGAGKSLLTKIICGLVKPDKGEVFIDGESIKGMREVALSRVRAKIGMLFQNYALWDFMTVEENIAFPMRQAYPEKPDEEVKARVAELLSLVDLPGIQHQYPNELSGGMKKRVTWARAIINMAPILIYDDPTAGLDPVTSSKIFILLKEMKQNHKTTSIVITHDLKGASDICDRWLVLKEGKLIFDGTREEIEECNVKYVCQFWRGESEG